MISMQLNGVRQSVKVVEEFQKLIPAKKRVIMERFGARLQEEMVKRIQGQQLNVAALAVGYLIRKISAGQHAGVLVRTDRYTRAFRHMVDKGGAAVLYVVGKDKFSNTEYTKIAMWLEFGTRKMPARPHWAPLGEWGRRQFPAVMAEIVKDAYVTAHAKVKF